MFVCINGKIVTAREAKISIFDHGFLYGDGVYETLRTYNGKVFELDRHMKRLERSLELLGMNKGFDPDRMEQWIEELLKKNGFIESRVRIQVTRGNNGFDFADSQQLMVVIVAEKLVEPHEDVYKNGVDIVTIEGVRSLPQVKSISLLPMVVARREALKTQAFEAVFVERGKVREGSISNIFVVQGKQLITPKKGVLLGMTRASILRLARNMDLKVQEGDFSRLKLYNADEIFLTNTVKGLIPVKKVDGRKVGDGRPGAITKSLMEAFYEYTARTSE